MIRNIGNDIWMRQGDAGNISFDGLPVDHDYSVYLALKNSETRRIVREFQGTFNQTDGSVLFSFLPSSTDDVPVAEYEYGVKICYSSGGVVVEDTLIPDVTVEDNAIVEQAPPTFTIAEKCAEGTV